MIKTFSKAVVTGAGGFLGRALVAQLLEDNIEVLALDKHQVNGSSETFFQADITQKESLEGLSNFVERGDSDVVMFHMAGLNHSGQCREMPHEAVEVNIVGTHNVLEICRKIGIRRVVLPSSSLVYRRNIERPYIETDSTIPSSVYAATKLAVEKLLEAYSYEYGMSCAVARLGNIYGVGASQDSICSILMRQALQGEPFKVRSLRPIRDFIYVKDVAEGLIGLIDSEKTEGYQLFNLATGQGTSIEALALTISELTDKTDEIYETESEEPQTELVLCIKKIMSERDWQPKWTLKAGLADSLKLMGFER